MDLEKEKIEQEGEKIEKFLEHSFNSVKVEHVEPSLVTSRTTIGFDSSDALDKFQKYYRVKVNSETKDEVLETRADMIDYFRTQLNEMETKSDAPDTMMVATDFPPQHINKPLVFYVRSTL